MAEVEMKAIKKAYNFMDAARLIAQRINTEETDALVECLLEAENLIYEEFLEEV